MPKFNLLSMIVSFFVVALFGSSSAFAVGGQELNNLSCNASYGVFYKTIGMYGEEQDVTDTTQSKLVITIPIVAEALNTIKTEDRDVAYTAVLQDEYFSVFLTDKTIGVGTNLVASSSILNNGETASLFLDASKDSKLVADWSELEHSERGYPIRDSLKVTFVTVQCARVGNQTR